MLRGLKARFFIRHPYRFFIISVITVVCLLGFISTCYAAGADLLDGSGGDLVATLTGARFRMYLYLAEGLIALMTYIKTKQYIHLFGIIIVAAFFNFILFVSGAM